jgi:RarD protein
MTIFGTVGIFVRYIPVPSATVAFIRGVLGLLFLLGVMAVSGKRIRRQALKKNLWVLLLSGGAIGLNWVFLFESYNYTTVATATICYYLAPVFLVLASPLLGERLTGKKCLLCAVALVGMVFVSGVLEGGLSGGKGIAFAVAAAALYASVMFMNKKLGTIDAYDKTIVQLFSAAVVILPYCLLSGGFGMGQMAGKDYALLAVVGIVHTGVAYWLYFGALGKLPSQTVALFSYLDPVIAIMLSALWLREPLGWQGALGAALILGSTLAGELPIEKMDRKFAKKG